LKRGGRLGAAARICDGLCRPLLVMSCRRAPRGDLMWHCAGCRAPTGRCGPSWRCEARTCCSRRAHTRAPHARSEHVSPRLASLRLDASSPLCTGLQRRRGKRSKCSVRLSGAVYARDSPPGIGVHRVGHSVTSPSRVNVPSRKRPNLPAGKRRTGAVRRRGRGIRRSLPRPRQE
jgi:hypothetical protein